MNQEDFNKELEVFTSPEAILENLLRESMRIKHRMKRFYDRKYKKNPRLFTV